MCHVTVMMNLFNFSQKKKNCFEFVKYLSIVLFQNEESNSILLVEELNFCFLVCFSGLVAHEN